MKKLATIALVVLVLLNVLGYYGVFLGLQYQNSRQMTQRFDDGRYDESSAVTIEIPLSIPYVSGSGEFQRVNGEFEYEGEIYRMVKQRLSNDTLYIVCVKDHEGKRIGQALKDYVKTFSDNPGDNNSSTKTLPSLIKDYISSSGASSLSSEGWSAIVVHQSRLRVFIPSFCASIVHPPERA